MPAWIPVVFATITPVGFAVNAAFIRYLHYELKFDPKTVQFSSALVMNCLTLAIAIIFWWYFDGHIYLAFNWNLFWWGFAGGIINIIGIVSLQIAIS